MRDLYPTLKGEEKERAERLFPELKENGDERTKNEIIAFVEQSIHRGGGTPIPEEQEAKWIAWLEKQVGYNPAWSEEDEAKIVKLKSFIAQCKGFNKENRNKAFDLIDSIKPRHTWKPSDMQRKALAYACDGKMLYLDDLNSLYNDLKKLM